MVVVRNLNTPPPSIDHSEWHGKGWGTGEEPENHPGRYDVHDEPAPAGASGYHRANGTSHGYGNTHDGAGNIDGTCYDY